MPFLSPIVSASQGPRCNVSPSPTDVSTTENSWMLHPLDKVSLGYFAPDQTIPSLNSEWIERSDTRLPTAASFSARSSMCGLSVQRRGANPINLVRGVGKAGQTPHWSIRCRRRTEVAIAADRGHDSGRRSKFHASCGPGLGHIGQGQNIQGMLCSRGATSKNFRLGTQRSGTHQPCRTPHHNHFFIPLHWRIVPKRSIPGPIGHILSVHKWNIFVPVPDSIMARITTARMRRITLIPCIHSFHLWQSGGNKFLGFGSTLFVWYFCTYIPQAMLHICRAYWWKYNYY
jgi:hypothetical protein